MSEDAPQSTQGSSRRDFVKKSLAVGAVVWSAPVVTSMPGGRAWAQQYPGCACNADAYGLFVSIPALAIEQTFGVGGCVANVNQGSSPTASVVATTVCGTSFSTVNAGCSAEATIATLDVIVGPKATPTLRVRAGVLLTTASASCSPCGTTGDFSAAFVTVSGSLVGGTINVNVGAACNTSIAGGIVVVNEQTCDGNQLNVNALHINVPGVIEVIAAHSAAGAENCPCTTCS